MPLTNAQAKAAAPRSRAYKLTDGQGLFLFVTRAGGKSWRWKFRYRGREQLLTFGQWPEVSIADARAQRDDGRAMLRRGVNPAAERRRARASSADTVELATRAWFAERAARWSDVHAADVIGSLERHVFPAIGASPIAEVDEEQLLELLRGIEADGSIETARRLLQRLRAIFSRAKRKKLITSNPAADLGGELAPRPPAKQQLALTDIGDARELLAAQTRARARFIVKQASTFLALTGVRLAALRGATWGEIANLHSQDADSPAIWRIPAERMKLTKGKKADPRFAHLVPLSRQAVELLRAIAAENGYDTQSPPMDALIFPGARKNRSIGEGAIGALYAEIGYAGRHVPHGWRSTFSTIMNELEPENSALIDRALSHAPKDKIEAAYNRAEHLERRRALFQRWADQLIGA